MPTIGVAIPVPEPWGSDLRRMRGEFGDDQAEKIPSHVTLLPPTDVSERSLGQVVDKLTADARSIDPYVMHLRGTGTFRPVSPVVFVAVSEGISSTEQLAKHVRDGLLEGELEFPYHPHVTVAHLVSDEVLDHAYRELSDFEARFEVRSFALWRHDDEAGWLPLQEFPLG